MKNYPIKTFLVSLLTLLSLNVAIAGTWETLQKDYDEFYSVDRFMRLGIIFAGGALMANTDIDENFQDKLRGNIYSADESYFVKQFGEGKYLISLSLLSAGMSNYFKNSNEPRTGIGKWGELTARAYFTGGPTVLATQWLVGASRPSENNGVSDWKTPLTDTNGVSGHSFVGAVPFLSIAYMNQDNALIKYSAYLASTLSAASRINDNQHFLSQAILGWYLAWESVDAIYSVDENQNIKIAPLVKKDVFGLQLSMRW